MSYPFMQSSLSLFPSFRASIAHLQLFTYIGIVEKLVMNTAKKIFDNSALWQATILSEKAVKIEQDFYETVHIDGKSRGKNQNI